MANLSKIKRDELLAFIDKLKEENNDDESMRSLNEIANALTEKKYGLVWEKHTEKVDEMLEHNIPVFEEVEERKIKADDSNDYNFLLEGDNLHSLKLLEKTHKGKIDVIYIDPPYNTGNKDFIYNDSYVDKTDGYVHSKWLSFMSERLEIAKELLSDEGVIFISIDENEYGQLKLLCDEVFGEDNFIENFIWIKNSTKNLSKTTSTNHEYITVYCKDINSVFKASLFRQEKEGLNIVLNAVKKWKEEGLSYKEAEKKLKALIKSNPEWKGISMYNMIDENWNIYTSSDSSAPKSTGIANTYEVIHPITKKPCKIPSRGWAYTYETMQEHIKNNLILFGKDETTVPRFKRLLSTVTDEVKKSIITDFTDGKKELNKIFGASPFDNPKPTTLIRNLLSTLSRNSTVLDFFAGSGTTGHAVMQLNKEDGGNRKYILCTNNENNICEEVTYQRLKNIQAELPHNLKYLKTDFIPKFDNKDNEESLSDRLIDYIKPLIELEYMCEIDGKNKLILLDESDVENVINQANYGATIFRASDVFISGVQMKEIKDKEIKVIDIPEYYFKNELMEVGEL